jgi:uncharacterized protein YutD
MKFLSVKELNKSKRKMKLVIDLRTYLEILLEVVANYQLIIVDQEFDQVKVKCVFKSINVKSNLEDGLSNFKNRSYGK